MKTVLVLGARSPAALELCRGLEASGSAVIAADSLRFPLVSMSTTISRYLRLPSPRFATDDWVEALSTAISKFAVDLVVPTCEEAFYLSQYRHRLPVSCEYFVDDIGKLSRFHNKFDIIEAAAGCDIGLPETQLITNGDEAVAAVAGNIINHQPVNGVVLKQVFSRFSEGVLIKPTEEAARGIDATTDRLYVAQAFVPGTEYCCYAVAHHGRLKAVSVYQPLYRAGLGAGIFFEPAARPEVEQFVRKFVKKHEFHGQISFDFIAGDDGQTYVIECNPRATSGIHLLHPDTDWNAIFGIGLEDEDHCHTAQPRSKMLAMAMWLYGLKSALKSPKQYLRDMHRAQDVILRRTDIVPAFGQLLSFAEIVARSLFQRTSIIAASTADIRWDGDHE